jgi:hypothetical protein
LPPRLKTAMNSKNPPSTTQERRSAIERQLLQEHALWVSRSLQCASPDVAKDLRVLLNGLQRMIDSERRRDMPQMLRAEIMDVLERTGEDEHGLDAVSMVRAARSLSSCGGIPEPERANDRDLLIESIRVLEQKNRQQSVLINRLQQVDQYKPSPEFNVQTQVAKRPSLLLRIKAFLGRKNASQADTAFMAKNLLKNHVDPQDLKTIILTVHGQSNARSLFDVIADWTSEKLRARRVVRSWAAGQLYTSLLAEPDDVSCRFGEWLTHVEPPPHLQRFIDDLRMWHSHWHGMAAQWSQVSDNESKRDFAVEVIQKQGHNPFVHSMRRIDESLMEMAKAAESQRNQ